MDALYPPLASWSPDPLALDDGWDTPAPEYTAHVEQLDSLHRPAPLLQNPLSCIYRHFEERPDDETLIPWNNAKRQSLTLAERLHRSTATLELAGRMRSCQHYLSFRPLHDGRWAISDTRRCSCRLCPCDQLARARRLRPRVDALAEGIAKHGALVFATLQAKQASPRELWACWSRVQNQRIFRRAVLGSFVGLHISMGLRPHLHCLLVVDQPAPVPLRTVHSSYTPAELPEFVRPQHTLSSFSSLWHAACHKVGLTSPRTHVEAVHNPPQALQYIARPAVPALIEDDALPSLFALLHLVRTIRANGICAEYWTPTDFEAPDWLGGPQETRRYGWDQSEYEISAE